ncbi:hypothetical protein ZWY2020_002971 [Hordeum vulgare]|nr:hypothetical protein ZWY2020_002971 [Hordeum vulgare]
MVGSPPSLAMVDTKPPSSVVEAPRPAVAASGAPTPSILVAELAAGYMLQATVIVFFPRMAKDMLTICLHYEDAN